MHVIQSLTFHVHIDLLSLAYNTLAFSTDGGLWCRPPRPHQGILMRLDALRGTEMSYLFTKRLFFCHRAGPSQIFIATSLTTLSTVDLPNECPQTPNPIRRL